LSGSAASPHLRVAARSVDTSPILVSIIAIAAKCGTACAVAMKSARRSPLTR